MFLAELVKGLEIEEIRGELNLNIEDVSCNSREIKNNCLFVCIKGSNSDGHLFAKEAGSKGAIAFVVEKDIDINSKKTVIKVSSTRHALAMLANKFHDNPSKKIRLIGVTGTDGKTTTTYLIESIFRANGFKIGVIGTIEYRLDDLKLKSINTTPESLDLAKLFSRMVDSKFYAAVVEVSSHSLEMHRVDYCDFDMAIFTNITHDHLDFHKNFENYLSAKIKLFENLKKEGYAIINLDDNSAKKIIESTNAKLVGYSMNKDIKNITGNHKFSFLITAGSIKSTIDGVSFNVYTPSGILDVKLQLIGIYNVSNALAAIACGIASGIDLKTIKKGLESVKNVPGRFEKINGNEAENKSFAVIVDYAHTPDALRRVLTSAKEFTNNRLITVFGCGGDRDRTKRPVMGEIASRISDITIITSDNPRTEDPLKIINEIETGVSKSKKYLIIPDRKEAIKKAILEIAEKGDLVLIAGKGHEDYQIFKDKTIHFSDREIAGELLGKRSQSHFSLKTETS